jgi:hypothetical protein
MNEAGGLTPFTHRALELTPPTPARRLRHPSACATTQQLRPDWVAPPQAVLHGRMVPWQRALLHSGPDPDCTRRPHSTSTPVIITLHDGRRSSTAAPRQCEGLRRQGRAELRQSRRGDPRGTGGRPAAEATGRSTARSGSRTATQGHSCAGTRVEGQPSTCSSRR